METLAEPREEIPGENNQSHIENSIGRIKPSMGGSLSPYGFSNNMRLGILRWSTGKGFGMFLFIYLTSMYDLYALVEF